MKKNKSKSPRASLLEKQLGNALKQHLNIEDVIFCVHDTKGTILKFLYPAHGYPYTEFRTQLFSNKNLKRDFSFTQFNPENEINALPQKYNPEKLDLVGGIWTSLPHVMLFSRKIDSNRFLGRLQYVYLAPNIQMPNITGILYADMINETLIGLNEYFFKLFKGRWKRPCEMIGQPLNAFFTPTPCINQNEMLNSYPVSLAESFAVVQQGKMEGVEIFQLAEGINLIGEDFHLKVEILNQSGLGPQIYISDSRSKKFETGLDANGYMAGIEKTSRRPVIKKKGFIVARSNPIKEVPERLTIEFYKLGPCLKLFMGGRFFVGYYDKDMLPLKKGGLVVGKRKGDAFNITSLVHKKGRLVSNQPSPKIDIVKSVGQNRHKYFLSEPFFPPILSDARYNHAAGYLLTDISEIHGKSLELERNLRKEIKVKKALERRVRKYEEGESQICWGTSALMESVRRDCESMANTDATVLIEGETGVGKEILTREIHRLSQRNQGPFVKVDCATIPESLFESHLFGHLKGAFTGAHTENTGMLQSADKGTLFLDEAGNLSLRIQAKLLQFFNDFHVSPLGGTRSIHLDVRAIIASNRSLGDRVKEGTFRADLFHRINVLHLRIPSLRERPEDISLLLNHFIELYTRDQNKNIAGISSEALMKLEKYHWPGNIREFQHVIQRAIIFSTGRMIQEKEIRLEKGDKTISAQKTRKARTPFVLSKTSRRVVEKAIKDHFGVVKKAAESLGIHRSTLYDYLNKNKMKPERYRKGIE